MPQSKGSAAFVFIGGVLLGDFLDEIRQSGVKPLELCYQNVLSTEFGSVYAYRSILKINNLDMGVLFPSQYLPVAQRTNQCVELAVWNIKTACNDIIKINDSRPDFEFVSVYIPIRMLLKTDIVKTLQDIFLQQNFKQPAKLCLELPSEILYEDRQQVNNMLSNISKLGVRTLLQDFGSEFSPTLRLQNLKVNYVLLHPYIIEQLSSSEDSVGADSTATFVHEQGYKIIADGVKDKEALEIAYRYNCAGVCGSIDDSKRSLHSIKRQ